MRRNLVIHWGRESPPIGGVTRCIETARRWSEGVGVPSILVDVRKPGSWVSALRKARAARLSIFHISSPRSVGLYRRVAKVLPHHTVAYFHGGTQIPALATLKATDLNVFSSAWATNEAVANALQDVTNRTIQLVSPFSNSAQSPVDGRIVPTAPRKNRGEDSYVVLAALNEGRPAYGIEFLLEVLHTLRARGYPLELRVLVYGRVSPDNPIVHQLQTSEWIHTTCNASPDEVRRLLLQADALVRPTSTDGDSLLVREALEHGVRVIASDVVPRPAGVELAPLDVAAFAFAILNVRSRVSSGRGLGLPLSVAISDLLADESAGV
jgi:glycosyltransferase involved in cell wall biosynthesis